MEKIKFSEAQKEGLRQCLDEFIQKSKTYQGKAMEAKDPIGRIFSTMITDAEKVRAFLIVEAVSTGEE